MRQLLVVGNWKLHGNKNTITNSLHSLITKLVNVSTCQIAIAPPLVYLDAAGHCLLHSHIKLCAQNVDIHLSGAFTGDISASMLQDLNVKYVLIGHAERRILHKENDLHIIKKFSILKKIGLIPILCIGENKSEYDAKTTKAVCIKQIESIIQSLGIQSFINSIIAYEPIWAIGNSSSASPTEVQSIHQHIRNHIAQYDTHIAEQILIQYGGSVNTSNVISLISQKDIDGVLIGSASLDINNFSSIIQLIENYVNQ